MMQNGKGIPPMKIPNLGRGLEPQGRNPGVRAVQGADGMYLVAVWTDQDRALVQALHAKLDVLLGMFRAPVSVLPTALDQTPAAAIQEVQDASASVLPTHPE